MNLQGKTILVTGAGGFIGSHLVQLLLKCGGTVRAFIRYNSLNSRGFIDHFPQAEQNAIEIIAGDLKDAETVRRAVKGADIVMHLGASIAIPYSYSNPIDVIQTNVIGTMNVAKAVLDAEVPRLVHTSTSEVYGTSRYVPMNEDHPLQGQSPYSASKIAADKILESFYCAYDLPVVTVRPFNAYGPRQSMRAVIPTIMMQALDGTEILLGNLAATRDFTFVEDTARAFVKAALADDHAVGRVFNAGSGNEISIGDLAAMIVDKIDRNIPVRTSAQRLRPEKSEVSRLFSDSSLAAEVLGWKPEVSLEDGIERTIEWLRLNQKLYRANDYVT